MSAVPAGCARPGCTGTILDGYCDVCGDPAARAVPVVVPVVPAAGSAPADAAADQGSSSVVPAAPLGSARGSATQTVRAARPVSVRLRGARLGAGLTKVPPAPVTDPEQAVLKDPQVPESRRHCPFCNSPVGRARDGRPGRTEGFCGNCGNRYSFTPKLRPGDLVAGQYAVAGCLAHGGLGWVYLARDRNVHDRWVVLKGLLNSGDADAAAAAVAERRFLAQVAHPLIVEIYNFVLHDGAGYIVMEYVGGISLRDILTRRREAAGRPDPIPVDQALAYLLEVLPAFGYLHDLGLLYCDFKPDNIIQAGDAVKLIDLGGVRLEADTDSPIYGTVGYQAPEVAAAGASVASDLYTLGRTLAVMIMDFRGYQGRYATSLPPVADVPAFQRYDSLHRLLAKACAGHPADRFATADELRIQVLGVLREVVAQDRHAGTAAEHSVPSTLFRAPSGDAEELTWRNLPAVELDEDDPQLAAVLGRLGPGVARDQLIEQLEDVRDASGEVRLALAGQLLAAGRPEQAEEVARALLAEDPWEWRAAWYCGLVALQRGDADAAAAEFNAVYGEVPGELAPKLALALACELGDRPDVAERLYLACLRTDSLYAAAGAFGVARLRLARVRAVVAGATGTPAQAAYLAKDRVDAVLAALDLVPPANRSFVAARRRRAAVLIEFGASLEALEAAAGSVADVTLDPADALRLRAQVLNAALEQVRDAGARPDVTVAGVPGEEGPLRAELERCYRRLVTMTDAPAERVRLVDRARGVRAWSWT